MSPPEYFTAAQRQFLRGKERIIQDWFFPRKKKEATLGFPDFYFYSGKFPEDDLFRPIFGEREEEEGPTAYYNLKRRPLRPFGRPLGGLKAICQRNFNETRL